jgi:hypothetical protein
VRRVCISASKHSGYKPGEFVQGAFGWQDYIATDGTGFIPMRSLPPGVPPNLALSLFGITGPTAYFGVLDVGQLPGACPWYPRDRNALRGYGMRPIVVASAITARRVRNVIFTRRYRRALLQS